MTAQLPVVSGRVQLPHSSLCLPLPQLLPRCLPGWRSAPCSWAWHPCPVLRGRGAQPAVVPVGWFPSVCCSWVPCWATCVSCGGVEALGRAGCSQRCLHVKHCLELWLEVHHGHTDWEHWQCEMSGLHMSQISSELPAAPSQALGPRIAAAACGEGAGTSFLWQRTLGC